MSKGHTPFLSHLHASTSYTADPRNISMRITSAIGVITTQAIRMQSEGHQPVFVFILSHATRTCYFLLWYTSQSLSGVYRARMWLRYQLHRTSKPVSLLWSIWSLNSERGFGDAFCLQNYELAGYPGTLGELVRTLWATWVQDPEWLPVLV
jgi:hypothetical protein